MKLKFLLALLIPICVLFALAPAGAAEIQVPQLQHVPDSALGSHHDIGPLAWSDQDLASLALLIIPEYSDVLAVSRAEASVLLGVMGVAIGIGSTSAGLISGHAIRPGLIPIGAAGLTLFFWLLGTVPPTAVTLYNYDINRDDHPGLLIARGGSGHTEAESAKIRQAVQIYFGDLGSGAAIDVSADENYPFAWIQMIKGEVKIGDVSLAAGDGAAIEGSAFKINGSETAEFLLFRLS